MKGELGVLTPGEISFYLNGRYSHGINPGIPGWVLSVASFLVLCVSILQRDKTAGMRKLLQNRPSWVTARNSKVVQ